MLPRPPGRRDGRDAGAVVVSLSVAVFFWGHGFGETKNNERALSELVTLVPVCGAGRRVDAAAGRSGGRHDSRACVRPASRVCGHGPQRRPPAGVRGCTRPHRAVSPDHERRPRNAAPSHRQPGGSARRRHRDAPDDVLALGVCEHVQPSAVRCARHHSCVLRGRQRRHRRDAEDFRRNAQGTARASILPAVDHCRQGQPVR